MAVIAQSDTGEIRVLISNGLKMMDDGRRGLRCEDHVLVNDAGQRMQDVEMGHAAALNKSGSAKIIRR